MHWQVAGPRALLRFNGRIESRAAAWEEGVFLLGGAAPPRAVWCLICDLDVSVNEVLAASFVSKSHEDQCLNPKGVFKVVGFSRGVNPVTAKPVSSEAFESDRREPPHR